MTLLEWTYLLFLLTVLVGAVLFFGFLLRKRRFPIRWLVVHLGLAAVTLVFFSLAIFR